MFVTYFLLLASQMLCHREIRRLRLLAACLFGGAYALTILLPPIPPALSVLMRAAACILLRLIADGFRSLRRFLKGLLVFLGVNCVFAGMMLLLQFLRPERLLYAAGVVYFDVSVPFILLSSLLAFGAIRLVMRLASGRHTDVPHGNIEIFMGARSVKCVGILDTGHHLTDPFSGKPVLIVSVHVLEPLVPASVLSFLRGASLFNCSVPDEFTGKLRLFPYRAVGSSGLLPALRCSNVRIECGTKQYIRQDVYVAAAPRELAGGDYDALIPGSVYDEMEGEETNAVQNDRSQSHAAAHPPAAVRTVGALRRFCANAAAAARQAGRGAGARTAARRRRKRAAGVDRP